MNENDLRIATERARQTFLDEADDLIVAMESALLGLEANPGDADLLHGLFRAVHTVKGSGGMFGLSALVAFAHRVETVLDHLRNGNRHLDRTATSLLLQCIDQIADLLRHARECPQQAIPDALLQHAEHLAGQLEAGGSMPSVAPMAVAPALPEPAPEAATWHISLRFAADAFRHGIDPFATLRYLASLGDILLAETIDATLPRLAGLDAENCYLGFEIRLSTTATRAELDDAFEFIHDECTIHLIPPGKSLAGYLQLIEDLPDDAERLGEILMACGVLDARQLHEALARQHTAAANAGAHGRIGEILQTQAHISPVLIDAALQKQERIRAAKVDTGRCLRVAPEKVDALIDMVGELLVLGAVARQQAARSGAANLHETMDALDALLAQVRGNAMSLRMVAIGETFERFRRVVRDTTGQLGKSVRLEIHGGDTELDKAVIEKIGDPLMHLVRNALDHGLETPAERIASGKPEEGVLTLSARHAAGCILLQIEDDGRGIDPERVLAKARQRGLLREGVALSHEQVLQLIFEPGFSTAEAVTDISGRGVGMDVVKRNIEALRGSIDIHSSPGQGCRITLALPLTLAIIDGFLVRCGEGHFVLPLDHVEECIDLGDDAVCGRTGMVMHRGQPLPVLNIREMLGVASGTTSRKSAVVVRTATGAAAGLQVDRLLGEQQTVIKPLGPMFSTLDFVAGSSVLGSGEIAFILDVQALLATVEPPALTTAG